MQAMTGRFQWHRSRFPARWWAVSTPDRRELRSGLLGGLAVAALLALCAAVYILPWGKTTYTALLPDAGAIRVGDDVRIAGIPVGEVTALRMDDEHVRMSFTVDDGTTLGDASSLEVRMLTAIGGHYVAVLPAGDAPLGDGAIPPERIRLPYSLIRVFQDAQAPVADLDASALRRSLTTLSGALGDNPDGLRRVLDAASALTEVLNRQREDVTAALAMADEYIGMLDSAKSVIGRLVARIGEVETILIDKRDEINAALPLTIRLLSRIAALEPAYRGTLQPLVEELAAAMPDLQELGRRLDVSIVGLHDLGLRVARFADQVADPAGICVPVAGRGC
ncbi:MCE family protein [Nocardia puris]|uniref:MlaD family protein n=2 Tax=Nocardia puris TaxID=208602 RepID=UPI00189627B5|nr:MlaD family protein [Nocardia puris]MBF6209646.1 MCE family protein [Nocardia puris]MBF6366218.1 MCE family protein [Nocardia puris]